MALREDASVWTPATWQTLQQGGIAWRGIPLRELDLDTESERLRAWTRGNLESYWRPWLAKSRWLPPRFGAWSLRPDFVEWGVPGVIRLHDTLAPAKSR